MQGEITTDAVGNQVLDLPSPDSLSRVDALKSNAEFVNRYLSGDKSAQFEMSAAIREQNAPALEPVQTEASSPTLAHAQEPTTQGPAMYQDAPFSLNFGELARSMSIEQMQQSNHEAVSFMERYGIGGEEMNGLFGRVLSNAQTPIEDAEAAKEATLAALQEQWGKDYQRNLDAIFDVLAADEELDQLLVNTGSWSDPFILNSILEARSR